MVPNLYPALTRADGAAPTQPAAAETRGAPELFVSLPADRRARGDHQRAAAGALAGRAAARAGRDRGRDAGASGCARTRSSAYLQLIVNERREAGASLPHTHAQLYALDFVPAAVARERERASAYTTRTMGQSLLGDLVAEEVRRASGSSRSTTRPC